MDSGRLARWSPLSGIAFVVLFVVGSALYDRVPDISASDAAIAAYYTDSGNQLTLQVAYLVLTLAAVLFVWFVGTLSALVRRAEDQDGVLSRVILVSGGAYVTLTLVGTILVEMTADIGDDTNAFHIDPNATRLFTDAYYTYVFETALPLVAPLVFAASLAFLRTTSSPRWLAWAGVVVSVTCLVGFLGVPMGLFLLWTAAVSISMVRRPTPIPATAATS